MYTSKHKHLDIEIIRLYDSGKSIYEIVKAFGVGHSVVEYRLSKYDVPMRTISQALVGKPKSEEHCKALSQTRIDKGLARAEKNPNWNGGTSSEYDKKMAAVKRSPMYKEWRKSVVSVGFCKSCGSTENLYAHHILPKSKFPNLIHDLANGICLCRSCHTRLHSEGANLESARIAGNSQRKDGDNPQPSLETGRFNDYVRTPQGKI